MPCTTWESRSAPHQGSTVALVVWAQVSLPPGVRATELSLLLVDWCGSAGELSNSATTYAQIQDSELARPTIYTISELLEHVQEASPADPNL